MYIIGIDNGVSGWIGVINTITNKRFLVKKTTISVYDYTKEKKKITRLDHDKLIGFLETFPSSKTKILWERPFLNPMMFKASCSALRCYESELIAIEASKIPYSYIDSKQWQSRLLPKGLFVKQKALNKREKEDMSNDEKKAYSKKVKARNALRKKELKNAARDIAKRKFPLLDITTENADAILIAEYGRMAL